MPSLYADLPEINFSVGRLNSVRKFDASFFGITNEHGEYMDPLCRILLEKTYETICDAGLPITRVSSFSTFTCSTTSFLLHPGYNFLEFKNKSVAVFVANCTSDAEVESTFRTDVKGALICERAQSFLANRISYWLGVHGKIFRHNSHNFSTSKFYNNTLRVDFYFLTFERFFYQLLSLV